MRRLGSLVVLLVLVAGPPMALARWGFYAWGELSLTAPADVRMLVGVLTVIGWVAWAWFALATAIELVQLLGGRRIRLALPGFDLPRALAGGLLAAAFAATAASGPAMAAPASGGSSLDAAPTRSHVAAPAVVSSPQPATVSTHDAAGREWAQHTVVPGDDLWSLAERYCGDGHQWRELAKVNAGVLGANPIDDLRVGTVLRVPAPSGTYTVKAGDTLWQIAENHLGGGARFHDLVRANASLIKDPAHIEPGWVLTIPGAQGVAESSDSSSQGVAPSVQVAPAPAQLTPSAVATPSPAAPAPSAQSPAPEPASSTAASPEGTTPSPGAIPSTPASTHASDTAGALDQRAVRAALGGLASLAAAGLLARLALNRRGRGGSRDVGEVFLPPTDEQARLESALGLAASGQTPAASWEREQLIATAQRLLAQAWWAAAEPAPRLRRALVSATGITFEWADELGTVPAPFVRQGTCATASWDALREVTLVEGPVAYPALVTLGERADDLVMVDVAGCGVLVVEGPDAAIPQASVAAMVLEMSANAWADQLDLVVVTPDARFATSAGGERVRCIADIDVALDEIDRIAFERAAQVQLDQTLYEQVRLDPDVGEAWTPVVYLFDASVTLDQAAAARRAVGTEPVGVGVVIPVMAEATVRRSDEPDSQEAPQQAIAVDAMHAAQASAVTRPGVRGAVEEGASSQRAGEDHIAGRHDRPRAIVRRDGTDPTVTLVPFDDEPPMTAQTLEPATREAIAGLLRGSTSTQTVAAAWWRDYAMPAGGVRVSTTVGPRRALLDDDIAAPEFEDDDPRTIDPRTIDPLPARQPDATTDSERKTDVPPESPSTLSEAPKPVETSSRQSPLEERALGALPNQEAQRVSDGPRLLLLGPVEIEGQRGKEPSKGKRRCLEYCAWLLENPGSVPTQMSRAMFVSEATRRSNLSRLRTWLGQDAVGRPYLPEAYTGRIELQGVTSDWQQFEELLGRGINVVDRTVLHEALSLVRGAPMADAAPGEWAWASRLRQTMVDMIRDAAVVAARLELERLDVAAARWSIERGLLVAPADELLACELMRVEASIGDVDAVEGIAGRLGRAASREGRELRLETVALIQELLEGGRRGVLAGDSESSTVASA